MIDWFVDQSFMYDGNFSAFSDTKRRQDQVNSLTVQNERVHSPLRSLVAFKSIIPINNSVDKANFKVWDNLSESFKNIFLCQI